jgi:hypothetical protein
MSLLYVRTGNGGADGDFLIDDLGLNVSTGASWTLLAASSPPDADGNTGIFTAREIRDSADLYDAINGGDLEWSKDGSAQEDAADYVADFMLMQDFTDDFMDLTDGRFALPNDTTLPSSGVDGETFWDNDGDTFYVYNGTEWQDLTDLISGILEHHELAGLDDDDHTQYLNTTRGDARYYREDEHINVSTGAGDAGKPIILNSSGLVDDSMLDIAADEVTFDPTGLPTSGTDVQTVIEELFGQSDDENEPSGFPNRTDSSIAFTNGTRTFTISPTGSTFDYYVDGQKLTSGEKSVVISDTQGVHFIYFDDTSGTLKSSTTWADDIITSYAYVAAIYWDATNNESITIGDERHGIQMDGVTHKYLHETVGTAWVDGLALGSINADQDGSANSHATFAVSNGEIADEDISHSISDGSPQDLDPTAQIPVLYRDGAAGVWLATDGSDYPLVYSGIEGYTDDLIAYNQWTGSTWQLTEVGNGDYVNIHIFATNDIDTPVMAVLGQAEHTSLASAQGAAETEINTLVTDGLPIEEWKSIATVIYQTASGYSNDVNARIVSTAEGDDYIDWRQAEGTPNSSISTSDHGNLTGLNDDDHSQYLQLAGNAARNPVTGKVNFSGGELRLPQAADVPGSFTSAEEGDIAWDTDDDDLYFYDGTQWLSIRGLAVSGLDHGDLVGLSDDDHTQYLNETRHDALAADNPHSVTFTQAVTADGSTDITAAEAETLTDTSNADSLHSHDHGNLEGNDDDDHAQYLLLAGDTTRNIVTGGLDVTSGELILPNATDIETAFPSADEGQVAWDSDDDNLYVYNGSEWVNIAGTLSGVLDHGTLTGLGDDDHTQYLNETRHDALPADNPHSVTFSQAAVADGNTDITAAEAETLTDGSNADSLHEHDHGALSGLDHDDHPQYTEWDNTETVSGLWTFSTTATDPAFIVEPDVTVPSTNIADGAVTIVSGVFYTYDDSRSSFLSVDRKLVTAAKRGAAKDMYLRHADNIATSETGFRALRDGTITAIGAQTDGAESWTLEIRKNDSAAVIASLVMSSVQGNQDTTVNVDFDQGDELQFFANVSGSAVWSPIGTIEIAWRI